MFSTLIGRTVLHVVCDYAAGDLASSEVLGAVSDQISASTRLIYTPVLAFNTVHTGFVSAQLARRPLKRDRRVLYINCAPRGDKKERRANNAGEGLVYGELRNGTIVVAVNSGYSLSWLRDDFVCLYEANVADFGSQFRSRDNFPAMVGWAAASWFGRLWRGRMLGAKLDPHAVIPPPPGSVVGYIDNFGNVKTSLLRGDELTANFQPGETVVVTLWRGWKDTSRIPLVGTSSFPRRSRNSCSKRRARVLKRLDFPVAQSSATTT